MMIIIMEVKLLEYGGKAGVTNKEEHPHVEGSLPLAFLADDEPVLARLLFDAQLRLFQCARRYRDAPAH